MLFGEDSVNPLVSFLGGTVLTTLLGGLSGAAVWWFTRKDRRQKEKERREDDEEETALQRLEKVMKLREDDCERRIAGCERRIGELERERGTRQEERDAFIRREAVYDARVKYLTGLLRRAKIDPENWDKPDTAPDGLPAIDTPHEGK